MVIHEEWVQVCIEKLRRNMTPREFHMLTAKFAGLTYQDIGKAKHGKGWTPISREHARNTVDELLIKAALILHGESGDDG